MYRYRMTVKSSVCFDVVADTDKEAVAKARAVRTEHIDGLVVTDGENCGMRVYMDEESEPVIADRCSEQSTA